MCLILSVYMNTFLKSLLYVTDISKQEKQQHFLFFEIWVVAFLFTKVYPALSQLISSYRTATSHCIQFTVQAMWTHSYYASYLICSLASGRWKQRQKTDAKDTQTEHTFQVLLYVSDP